MLGWRLVTKREMLLWAGVAQDLREEVKRLREELAKERARCDAAVNALLIKTQQIAITPETKAPDIDAINKAAFDLFNDAQEEEKMKAERDALERMQS